MITKLGVLDFQSIQQMAVECGPITVFVGESDSGKSAVVRALYAAAFNDYPSDHVREGASHSVVVLATDEGSVQVEKGKGKNTYALQLRGAARKAWDRVGRDVPEEVAAFLGWRVVELDDGTKFAPSIQRQFDGPFLLADSPVRVAKVLGSLTNIATLFAAIREGTLEERRLKRSADEALEESKRHAEAAEEAQIAHEAAQVAAGGAVAALEVVDGLQSRLQLLVAADEALIVTGEHEQKMRVELESARDRVVDVPDLEERFGRLEALTKAQVMAEVAAVTVREAKQSWDAALDAESQAVVAVAAYMENVEVCPLCERPMHWGESHEM